jgi:catechol 2,3-dioxygenase-like lactoylglutathione lyase family enzyme
MSRTPPSPTHPPGAPVPEVANAAVPLSVRHGFHGLQPVLPVADVARAARWFCEVLGFQLDFIAGEPPSYARVRHLPAQPAAPGWQGAVDGAAPFYIRLWQCGARPAPPWRGELVVHVGHDIDGLHAAYAARGVTVLEPPVSQPWGLREFAIREPDGHVLRFCAVV